MVGRAHEVKAVAAEQLGAQLRRLGARRGEREVGPAGADPLDAGLGQHVGHLQLDAGIGRRGTPPAPAAASRPPAKAAARWTRARAARHLVAHSCTPPRTPPARAAPRLELLALGRGPHVACCGRTGARRARFERADQRAEGGLRQVRRAAARVKLRCSANVRKARSWRVETFICIADHRSELSNSTEYRPAYSWMQTSAAGHETETNDALRHPARRLRRRLLRRPHRCRRPVVNG